MTNTQTVTDLSGLTIHILHTEWDHRGGIFLYRNVRAIASRRVILDQGIWVAPGNHIARDFRRDFVASPARQRHSKEKKEKEIEKRIIPIHRYTN